MTPLVCRWMKRSNSSPWHKSTLPSARRSPTRHRTRKKARSCDTLRKFSSMDSLPSATPCATSILSSVRDRPRLLTRFSPSTTCWDSSKQVRILWFRSRGNRVLISPCPRWAIELSSLPSPSQGHHLHALRTRRVQWPALPQDHD